MTADADKCVLITGVSSGIGHGLAEYYLKAGWQVLGMSRRTPDDMMPQSGFRFVSVDLSEASRIDAALESIVEGVRRFDLVILNAGVLGQFGDLLQADLADLLQTTQVNVWANWSLLNGIFGRGIEVKQVVAISSGASVNGNRGWSGYSISKAALNMLVRLYSREQPQTHFCALAPGLVDTAMQDVLCDRDPDGRFPAVEVLRSKRNTPEMPTAAAVAPRLASTIQRLPKLVESGDFADIRRLPDE